MAVDINLNFLKYITLDLSLYFPSILDFDISQIDTNSFTTGTTSQQGNHIFKHMI